MIPNIAKGSNVADALKYALGEGYQGVKMSPRQFAAARAAGVKTKGKKIMREQSRATLLGGQNFGFDINNAEDLELARRMMEWNARLDNQTSRTRKCEKHCMKASLSWEPGQIPGPDNMREAAESFLKALGMENALAVFIAHTDKAHAHVHIVASRIDLESGKTYRQNYDYRCAHAWALQYEREQGLRPKSKARATTHKILDAIYGGDLLAVAEFLAEQSPAFTIRQLNKVLSLAQMSLAERAKIRTELLASPDVIALQYTSGSAAPIYTTRRVLNGSRPLPDGVVVLSRETIESFVPTSPRPCPARKPKLDPSPS